MYKVFIADDNQLSRKALVTVVSWERYRCTVVGEADNGTDALEQIRLLRPDIVLLDIRMPGLTGLEVVRELKKEQPDCICIMITAYDDFLLIQQGVKLGVFDYILKPVVSAEMEDVMKRAVEEIGRREARTSELEELRTSIRQYCSEIEEHSSEIMRKLFNDGINGYVESVRKLKEMLLERGIFHDYELMLIVPGEKDRQMLDSWV
ncbi:MAG: response regulator, partial [Lachnospiraceae bacterium]|nr:response regulator [Lachnospiraceae bacterium]